jgi:hypothetical protein
MQTNRSLKGILNKKKIILSIIIAIVIIAVGIFAIKYLNNIADNTIESSSTNDSSTGIQATNMWLHWQDYSEDYYVYDAFTIDWRCIDSADETYWAVHCWDYGYAGFQNDVYGEKVLLMSLWDLEDGTKPEIEYFSSDYDYGRFGHEGSGAYVFTPYEWKVGTWYTMKIVIAYANKSTYFTQYIREENGPWQRTACIRYPTHYELKLPPSSFQEDFGLNNLKRSCEVKNAGGRIMDSQEWKMWDACELVTNYYPDTTDPDNFMDNVSFNCDYEVNNFTIKLITGGSGFEPNDKTYPVTIPLS